MRVATANINGIRAASRRGLASWLAERQPDILCLQEVRASDEILAGVIGEDWHTVHEESSAKGRAGVAVLSRIPPLEVRQGWTDGAVAETATEFKGSGRWVEADFLTGAEKTLLTVVSAYVHTGEAETPRQDEKYRFLSVVRQRMLDLTADGRYVIVCGDFNIAHREADLKNWRGNQGRAGFLPEERAWLDRLFDADGFVDVHRRLAGDGPGPYTWWSWRGRAFDTDAGWRIDYQITTPATAAKAIRAQADRAPSYALRWSDHAPLVVDYDLDFTSECSL